MHINLMWKHIDTTISFKLFCLFCVNFSVFGTNIALLYTSMLAKWNWYLVCEKAECNLAFSSLFVKTERKWGRKFLWKVELKLGTSSKYWFRNNTIWECCYMCENWYECSFCETCRERSGCLMSFAHDTYIQKSFGFSFSFGQYLSNGPRSLKIWQSVNGYHQQIEQTQQCPT